MKKIIIYVLTPFVCFLISCSGKISSEKTENDILQHMIEKLKTAGVSDTADGMLFLKRYQHYMSELRKGNAYVDWDESDNPPIYNSTVFVRMMNVKILAKITDNTIKGRDAYDGIKGLFERVYVSDVDGKIDSYIIYIPNSFDEENSYPLIVSLHGYGDSAFNSAYSSANTEMIKACEKRGVILAAPCGRQDLPQKRGLYLDDAEQDVLQVISLVRKSYPVDESRIYITGNSMGGFGTYWIASRHPELFAAAAPVCGIWSGIMGYPKVDLHGLKNMAVHLYHNDLDETVPVSESREAYAYLKKAGADVSYTEYKVRENDDWDYGIYHGHNAWDYAYQGTFLIDWFLEYSKN